MKTKNRGFTLLELLLTISILSIVALTMFQSIRYSMNVLQRTNSNVNLEVMKIMRQLSRDLRSAFLISKKHPAISFTGTGSSIKFVSIASLDHNFDGSKEFDLKERRYYLIPGEEGRLLTLMYAAKNFDTQSIPTSKEERQADTELALSSSIVSLTFAYFDGQEWLPSWNSLEQLPGSVRITIQFQEDGYKSPLGYFSTVILIPST